ncbi:hypothetical protein G4G28_13040 [Massilia sp. Dwa41.01b]|uniref:hypothetical protein n=1 Tax=unclassified Massilia TaxID=2609279 RepID=UPI0016041C8B|nr:MULTISPECIES: hypothetical protein [unclassified Massilia]QNA89161.1 hypothetical protein G4G28_13040 [Massilia sp. Dwa41.01b]QNB00057.1 hypothetical protein G4G31_16590 [Massilia sp. Se16.2.3]
MSTSTDKKDVSGRSWDQITKNGTSSAGSMGVGGTGDSGKLDRGDASQQSATRTDDLLDDGSAQEGDQQGYAGTMGGQVQTGMEGIGKGAGNRQSAGQSGGLNQQGAGGMRSTETDRDEGNSAREDGNR